MICLCCILVVILVVIQFSRSRILALHCFWRRCHSGIPCILQCKYGPLLLTLIWKWPSHVSDYASVVWYTHWATLVLPGQFSPRSLYGEHFPDEIQLKARIRVRSGLKNLISFWAVYHDQSLDVIRSWQNTESIRAVFAVTVVVATLLAGLMHDGRETTPLNLIHSLY